jgi:hypothetical protein
MSMGCAVLASGCAEPTTGQVSGLVSVDGQPAKTGSISFIPVSGQGSTAGGAITDGRYSVEAARGEVKVEIRVPRVVGQKALYEGAANSPVRQLMEETLPPKYNDATELRLDVTPGEMTKDFDLSTK